MIRTRKIAIIAQNGDKISQISFDSARKLLYGNKKLPKKQRKVQLNSCIVGVDGVAYKNCFIEIIDKVPMSKRRNPSPILYNAPPEDDSDASLLMSIDDDINIIFCSSDYDNFNANVIDGSGNYGFMEYLAITLSK